jgi:hypothetical protein
MSDFDNTSLEEMESEKKFDNNPYLSLEYIESHIDEDWDFDMLSHEKVMTPEFIIKYKDKDWDFNQYKLLKHISMNQFLEIQDKIEDYETLSRNHNISLEYIFEHDHKSWCWIEISKRKDLTGQFIDASKPLNFYLIFKNDKSVEFLRAHKQRIVKDLQDYIEHLCVYEKSREQKTFIDMILHFI